MPAILGVLALLGLGFALLQRRPEIEARVAGAFARRAPLAVALGGAIAVAMPFTMASNSYALHLLVVAQLYAVLAIALNFQLGSANIPNFATGASYGIGAHTSALLALNFDVSFWLALPAAALVATLFGSLLGLPSMRTRESYPALVTIAFGVVIDQLLNDFEWTGGPNGLVGIPAPSLFGHSFAAPIEAFGFRLPSQANFYYLSALLVLVAVVRARHLHASRVGLAWNAIRADELAARCQSIDVTWYKVLAFAVDIRLMGEDLRGLRTEGLARRGIGFVPEGRRLFPDLTVRENLRLGFDAARVEADFRERLDAMAELFPRVRERLGQRAGTLSGGEQAMVALARALVGGPRLVIMDEPSLGLSPKLIDEYFDVVTDINRRGTTVLPIEQNAERALSIAHRGDLIVKGRIAAAGSSAELLAHDVVRKLYL